MAGLISLFVFWVLAGACQRHGGVGGFFIVQFFFFFFPCQASHALWRHRAPSPITAALRNAFTSSTRRERVIQRRRHHRRPVADARCRRAAAHGESRGSNKRRRERAVSTVSLPGMRAHARGVHADESRRWRLSHGMVDGPAGTPTTQRHSRASSVGARCASIPDTQSSSQNGFEGARRQLCARTSSRGDGRLGRPLGISVRGRFRPPRRARGWWKGWPGQRPDTAATSVSTAKNRLEPHHQQPAPCPLFISFLSFPPLFFEA